MLDLHDPAARAQAAYRLWLETYARTRKPRHLATARACFLIMRQDQGRPHAATVAAIRLSVARALARYARTQETPA